MTWHEEAACKGHTDRMFLQVLYPLAKSTCARCPVRAACQTAGASERHGVWGGLTPEERDRVREKRKPSRRERAA